MDESNLDFLFSLHNCCQALWFTVEEIKMKTQGRTGRPRLGEGEGKRHTLGLRVTEQRKRQLEEAARASGRSLSAELEIRLEQSFWTEEILGGRELLAV